MHSTLPLLLVLPALLTARVASACASCACGDPIASRMGLPDASESGAVFAGVSADATRNRADYETQDDVSIAVVAGWSGARTRLLVRFPWVRREARFLGTELRREGVGDAEVTGMYELLHRGNVSAGHSAAVALTATLPTGENTRGEMESLQPGTGAPAATLGASWFGHRRADRVYASVGHRMNVERPSGYRAGDVELVNAGWQRPVPFSSHVDFTLELNARRAAPDYWPGGIRVADTGGDVLYTAPGLVVIAGPENEWLIRANVQLPVAQRTRGDQELGAVFQAGLFRSF